MKQRQLLPEMQRRSQNRPVSCRKAGGFAHCPCCTALPCRALYGQVWALMLLLSVCIVVKNNTAAARLIAADAPQAKGKGRFYE
jgi:hypothetical protein